MLSKRANIKRDLVYNYLLKLSQMKVISYIPSRKSPLIVFTEERLEDKSILISHEFYTERKRRFEQRINAMIDYAFNSEECRNNLLLKYFGLKRSKPCGQCDVCKSRLEDDINESRIEKHMAEVLNLLKENSQYLYVNVGIGYIGFPGRVGFMPEISVFELESANNPSSEK